MPAPDYCWISDEIFTVAHFFTPEECSQLIDAAEALGFADAPINTRQGPVMRQDVRNNTRVIVDDIELAEQLWERARVYIPDTIRGTTAVGLNERFRYYRYDPGQQFDWHRDGSFTRDNGDRSRVTFMVYLNGGFEGGETSIEQRSITPQAGLLLGFAHALLHKGEPVISGRKYVLRSDVMYRRLSD